MQGMFYLNHSLSNVDVSNFNTVKVTNMAGMFRECRNLKALDLSSFDTSQVSHATNMLTDCSYLNVVTCRTQKDVNKLKSILGTPTTINFIVKQ